MRLQYNLSPSNSSPVCANPRLARQYFHTTRRSCEVEASSFRRTWGTDPEPTWFHETPQSSMMVVAAAEQIAVALV